MKQALTVHQVAEILSVNERTVYRMVSKGELPGFRVAGSWRFLREDLEAWIAQQKAAARSEDKVGGEDEEGA
ncbi:helix-turn-helix domain-containing protein [Billgrantia antri]|uniref:helix-turn-helix domain-containing protein n=1 Tax=Billgrantia antri TaxID=2846777 RepID=UPI003B226808